MSAAPDPAFAKDRCWHQSEPSDQGVFRCTRPKGHEGEHRSTRASWYSDPPSHESVAAPDPFHPPRQFSVEFNDQDWRALPAQMQTRILESARPGNPKSRLLRNLLDAANLLERLWSS